METTIHDLMAQVRLTKRLLDDLHPQIIKLRASHDRLLAAADAVAGDIEAFLADEWDGSAVGWQALADRLRAAIALATEGQSEPDEPDRAGYPDLMATDYREGLELGHPDAGR